MSGENLKTVTKFNTESIFISIIKDCEKTLFKKSLINSSKWKKEYKKLLNEFQKDKVIPMGRLFNPIPNDPNFLTLNMWFYALEIENNDTSIVSVSNNDLTRVFEDKKFLHYYLSIVTSFNVLKSKNHFFNDNFTIFFGTLLRVIISYYLINEKNITPNKIRNLLSFLHDQQAIVNVSYTNEMIEKYIEQITTGIKEIIEKPSINSCVGNYTKQNEKNILTSINNSIRIKYVTGKKNKHSTHKSPISHFRTGHYRYYKSGKKVWVNSSVVNPNQQSA